MPESRTPEGRFVKGVSGNPGGKRTALRELELALQEFDPQCIEVVRKLLKSKSERVRLDTVALVWERAHGKPRQPIVGKDDGPVEINLSRLSDDEFKRLEELSAKIIDASEGG